MSVFAHGVLRKHLFFILGVLPKFGECVSAIRVVTLVHQQPPSLEIKSGAFDCQILHTCHSHHIVPSGSEQARDKYKYDETERN